MKIIAIRMYTAFMTTANPMAAGVRTPIPATRYFSPGLPECCDIIEFGKVILP